MITLASDFGSPYPAAMKGVILQRSDAQLVDVSHEFPRQDVGAAAFWLREILPYFPPVVHLVVVDPGVGTDRAAIVVEAGEHALVGPDNGVLLPAARALAGEDEQLTIYEIRDEDADSSTFHGRDIFAPAGAAVHEARTEDNPLSTIPDIALTDEYVDLRLPDPEIRDDEIVGEVLVVDGFGNVITNVPGYAIEGYEQVDVNGQAVPVGETFAAVPIGQWLATVGSHGNVELDVNQGRGDEAFDLEAGDTVRIQL